MKKYTIILLMTIVVISCKKDPIPILTMGDTSGLIVTNHNITFELDTNFYVSTYSAGVDLDQDGSNDLSFKMYEGNPDLYEGDDLHYEIEFNVWNTCCDRKIILPEIATSADWYVQTEIVYDYLGTYPRETYQETFTCETAVGANLGSILGGTEGAAVQLYSAGSDVFSLPEVESENIFYTLFSDDFQYRYWEFNMAEDSLIGYRKIKEVPCQGVAPFNQLFYIPFKFVYDDIDLINRTGWLELSLTDDYSFEILRSAISSN